MEHEKNYRNEIIKKQQDDFLEESLVSQEMDDLEDKIHSGEIPKDAKNLKRQYEVLTKNYK